VLRQDTAIAEKLATELIERPDDQRSPLDLAWGRVYAGWAIGKTGEVDRGISTLCEGLSYLRSAFPYMRSAHLALLAELYIDGEDFESARRSLDEASQRVSELDERLLESEILRLRAEICTRTGTEMLDQGVILLNAAIEVARRQDAKSLELRSCVALGKLWWQQDKRQEAHGLLAPVYEWFTEGFDTADLKEAKGLLDQLA
jgi:predicted ATPase